MLIHRTQTIHTLRRRIMKIGSERQDRGLLLRRLFRGDSWGVSVRMNCLMNKMPYVFSYFMVARFKVEFNYLTLVFRLYALNFFYSLILLSCNTIPVQIQFKHIIFTRPIIISYIPPVERLKYINIISVCLSFTNNIHSQTSNKICLLFYQAARKFKMYHLRCKAVKNKRN